LLFIIKLTLIKSFIEVNKIIVFILLTPIYKGLQT